MLTTALAVEAVKFRRSPVVWTATLLLCLAGPLLAVGFVALDRSGRARGRPLEAKLVGLPSGSAALAELFLIGQILAVALLLAGGVCIAWLFGREFADRTVGGLFGLPVPRPTIALAKIILFVAWSVAVSVSAVGGTLVAGWVLHPVGPDRAAWVQAGVAVAVGVLTGLLAVPFGLVATVGRGYLGAVGVILLTTVVTQLVAALGGGGWFPYAVPALWAGAAGPEAAAAVTAVRLATVVPVALLGAAGTLWCWARLRLA